jgi:dolichol-phosphate mannosyltransferase
VPDSIIIIPTYNEKENIERMIRKVFSLPHDFHLLIIDDGSPDGTNIIVKTFNERVPRAAFYSRAGGQTRAWVQLTSMVLNGPLQRHYDYIFEMDADFSHNPDDLLKLRQACIDGADAAIGSRYSNGVNVVNWPMSRVLMSYFASVYVRFITGIDVHDSTAGFHVLQAESTGNHPA